MNIKRVIEPKLYVEDDYGNFENIFETGDQLTIALKSGGTVSGGLTYIEDNLLEIENSDTEEIEKIKFSDIESISD